MKKTFPRRQAAGTRRRGVIFRTVDAGLALQDQAGGAALGAAGSAAGMRAAHSVTVTVYRSALPGGEHRAGSGVRVQRPAPTGSPAGTSYSATGPLASLTV